MSQIQFKGKQFTQNHHLAVKYHELIPKKDKSLTNKVRLDDNLIIRGDNLKALKALLPTYAGKVKCIYIDPPYNTGNEHWAYNDNVNSPMMQEWLGKVVDREDLTRHDKWLCMMAPRLKLLRELLRDDGVIFISIDDNEQHRLRMLMDEIFGEERFLASVIWQKVYSPRMDAKDFSVSHDYILVYGKTENSRVNLEIFNQDKEQFKVFDKVKNLYYRRRSWRKEGKGSLKADAPSLYFPLVAPDGSEVYPIKPDGTESRWRGKISTFEEELKQGNVEWVKTDDGWEIYIKQYYKGESTQPQETLWLHEEVGHNHEALDEISNIIGVRSFESPKPVRLIKKVLQLSTDKDSIILDSFAGSGTTAHAVLALNKEDGGNRKFILVEMEDYADSITAERVRRVIKGVKGAPAFAKAMAGKKDENLRKGLGGSFSYFELGKPIEMESILSAKDFPIYKDLARYVFYTATGEEFDEKEIDEKKNFIGESKEYEVYLFYKPEIEYLKNTALTLDRALALGKFKGKKRLIFAPTKYLDQDRLDELRIVFAQLPFEIYKLAE